MRPIRVALARMPEQLRYLVEGAVRGHPDLVVVMVDTGEVGMLLEAARSDVVVVAWSGIVPPVVERLLDEYPHLGVVCVDVEAGRGVLYRLRPDAVPIDDVSPPALAAAIRSAAADAPVGGRP